MNRLIKEAIEIELHPNNMIREDGLCLSQSWQPLIQSPKVRRNPLPKEYVVPSVLRTTQPPVRPVLLRDHILASSRLPPRPYKGLNSVLSHFHTIPLFYFGLPPHLPLAWLQTSILSHSHAIPLSLFYFGPPTHLPLTQFLAYCLSFPTGQPSPLDSHITAILSC
jgi:hypothetical protein